MATTTPRIGLTKPDGTDLVDIAVLNTNFDKIDSNIASTKIQSTKPTTANAGDLWWDSDTGTLYLYYVDANSSQWVAATSDPINIGVVANQTERDAQYPTPAQGMSVYRTDLGVTQRYYGLYNLSTNPGGRDSAGWYNEEKSAGLIPVKPTTATFVGGTGSVNAIGKISAANVTAVQLDGVFSARYTNYMVILSGLSYSAGGWTNLNFCAGGTSNASGNYGRSYVLHNATTLDIGATSAPTGNNCWATRNSGAAGGTVMNITLPYVAAWTGVTSYGDFNEGRQFMLSGKFAGNVSFDGFKLTLEAGVMNLEIQVYGYNN